MEEELKEIIARFLGLIAVFIVGLFACAVIMAQTSCTKTEYIAVPEYHIVEAKEKVVAHDSVYRRDSIHESLVSNLDTVFLTKSLTKYVYRDRLRIDTVTVQRTDTVTGIVTKTEAVVEVDKPLTHWQQLRIHMGELFIGLLAITIVVLIIRKKTA